MKKRLKRLMFSLRIFLGDYPKVFFPIYALKKRNKKLFIKEDTQIVVNAYPRCGNTYFYYALKKLNPHLNLSHHLHVPALTLEAVNKQKPLVVIVREPSEAIASLLIREDHVTINQAMKLYEKFHKTIFDNQGHILILDFNEVVNNFSNVISKINNQFNLNLNNYKSFGEKTEEEIFYSIERVDEKTNSLKKMNEYTVSRPSKNSMKLELKKKFKIKSKAHKRYSQCKWLYEELIKSSKKI